MKPAALSVSPKTSLSNYCILGQTELLGACSVAGRSHRGRVAVIVSGVQEKPWICVHVRLSNSIVSAMLAPCLLGVGWIPALAVVLWRAA